MNKFILSTSILLIAVFTVAYFYFSNLNAGNKNNDKALSLIPSSAALVFEFKNDRSFYEIFKDYKLFDAVIGAENKQEFEAVKNNLLELSQLKLVSSGQNIFLSFHPQKDSIAFLWTMPLKNSITNANLISALNQEQKIKTSWFDLKGMKIAAVNMAGISKPFYLYSDKGMACGTFSKNLLLEVTNSSLPKISGDFADEINKGSKNDNSPANVFINLTGSKEFLNAFFRQKKLSGNFNLLNNLKGFITLNMNYKSDALIFNGLTEIDTVNSNYFNLFLHQKEVKNTITRIVPSNTAYFIAYGLSDYSKFSADLKSFHSKKMNWGNYRML